ncbi:MAG: hypothetical protein RIQ59_756 [Bacteroidota bacterium]
MNKIKEYWAKKIVKKKLLNVKQLDSNSFVKKVGIVIDESYFSDKEALIVELIQNGIEAENVSILIFKDVIKKNENIDSPFFSYRDINWSGLIEKSDVVAFIELEFDLLISYYDIEKAGLLQTTNHSKAKFKVGFSSIDKRLNHFMIDTNAENYRVFIAELFKYLKILNKI